VCVSESERHRERQMLVGRCENRGKEGGRAGGWEGLRALKVNSAMHVQVVIIID
jgi:hypothetical protein